jgi:hypothetical protein
VRTVDLEAGLVVEPPAELMPSARDDVEAA